MKRAAFAATLALTLSILPGRAFANAVFTSGYAIVDGNPIQEVEHLLPNTVVVCTEKCTIRAVRSVILIQARGFGTFNEFAKTALTQKDIDSFLAEANPVAQGQENRLTAKKDKLAPPPDESTTSTSTTSTSTTMNTLLGASQPVTTSTLAAAPVSHNKYPRPLDNTLFLANHRAKIYVNPIEACQHPCRLEIRLGSKKQFEQNFAVGESPATTMVIEVKNSQGVFEWELHDDPQLYKGKFEVQPNKPGRFGEALKGNRNIVIGE